MPDAARPAPTVTVIVVPDALASNAAEGAIDIVTSVNPQFCDGSTDTLSADTRVTTICALLVSPCDISMATERLSTSTRYGYISTYAPREVTLMEYLPAFDGNCPESCVRETPNTFVPFTSMFIPFCEPAGEPM
jgi:hypothetical protein